MFNEIISLENLFSAWSEFRRNKGKKEDVLKFEKNLEDNIFSLHNDLKNGLYKHDEYTGFFITDPKRRHVHKATVRDRILHHSIFRVLYPVFAPKFIYHSFSCQIGKGTHKGIKSVQKMFRKVSKNNTQPCYALKCDVKKFFDGINHKILLEILSRRIKDEKVMRLLKEVIGSFGSYERERERERAILAEEYLSGTLHPNFLLMCI